ncbi:hypothetical protein M9194_07385 [Vibrio sp. S4M6]|uniref:hypothetical protein n=1 Tax=Vibrio sinus TaxID=2946865 RepID=UPI00202A7537|nr:hypothetical protein [Vibrio sinus]MCL9781249.1 hypothetical protein [Vibrio sinus]
MDIQDLIGSQLDNMASEKVAFDTLHFLYWYRMANKDTVLSVSEANELLASSQTEPWLELSGDYDSSQKLIWYYKKQ